MSAANSLETKSKPVADQRLPEPSMEEILASIRRIIADDESLPGRKDAAQSAPEAPELDMSRASEPDIEPAAPAPILSIGHLVSEDVVSEDVVSEEVLGPVILAHTPVTDDGPAHHQDPPTGRRSAFMAGYESSQTVSEPEDVPPLAVAPEGAPYETHVDEPVVADHQHHESNATPEEPISLPAMDTPIGQDAHALPSDALFSTATHQSVAAAFRTLAATRLADNSEELLDIAKDMIRPLLKSWIDNNVPSMVERMVRTEIERVARGGR